MAGKCFAGFIVTFWLVTMAALVRMEFFPDPLPINAVPTERILRKVFANPEPVRMNVYYQGENIGHCNVDITPMADARATVVAATGQTPQAYRVNSDLAVSLSVFGTRSRMRLNGRSVFDQSYEIQSFNIRTDIADGRVDIAGDRADGKVRVQFVLGDMIEKREFDFNQIDGAGMASALGLPGLANFSFLGGGGIPTGFGRTSGTRATTRTYVDQLSIGDGTLPAYLVELKLDDAMWAKMWVDDSGAILLVQTSLGLTMETDTLDTNGKFVQKPRARSRHAREDRFAP